MHNHNAARHSIVSIAVTGAAAALLIVADARGEIASSLALSSAGTEGQTQEEALAEAMRQYQLAFDGGLFDEAAVNMDRYIRLLLRDSTFDKRTWANALVSLGNAQRLLSEHDAAIQNYELAIDTLTTETNRLDESLIGPYLAAGEALAESGQYSKATKMLEFAVHLQQVNGGLYNMEQTTPLTQLSAVYLKLGDYPRAVASHTSNLSVVNQNYPGDDIRKAPAMLAHARVLAAAGHLFDSHNVYRRTISMIERAEGPQSPNLLPAFYEMVDFITNNYIKDGFDGVARARRFLQRAIHVAENSEAATPIHRADAYIQMGDYLALNTMNRPRAVRNYEKAWLNLADEKDSEEQLRQRFGRPIHLNAIPRGTGSTMRDVLLDVDEFGGDPDSVITVGFDVDAEGFPRNIVILEGSPDVHWSKFAIEHVNRFIFRPRFENGKAQMTEDLRWSFHSRVLYEELDD